MNTMRLAAALGICLLAASTGFIACGGDDSSSGGGPDGSLPDGGGGGNQDTGTGGGNDAGSDAAPLEAAAPNVGEVTCNNSPCKTKAPDNKYCCANDAGQACQANGTACAGDKTIAAHCDEAADCNSSNEVCCSVTTYTLSGNYKINSECKTTCPRTGELPASTIQRQVCKSSAECKDGLQCVTQKCAGEFVSTCGGVSDTYCTKQ